MVYTDNFHRFNYDSKKISCYYGIAPFGKDSGTSVHSDSRVHYMAIRQIKAMLTQAALAAVNFNPVMARYYMRFVERGKKKQVALNKVKNKLVYLALPWSETARFIPQNIKLQHKLKIMVKIFGY